MHVLDLFNDKDRNFLNGGSAISEGGMPDLNLEYQDYTKLPPMAFQSRYKMSKEAWAEKYKNLLPKPAPRDPTASMPDAPFEGVAQGQGQQLSVQQLATISDAALDKAYGYGRSQPGNSFGWQANLKSAQYAKQMIDKGITDIEAISDAIHKGWNVTAQAFVQKPEQFDDTAKLQAAGKLEAKLQQRAQLMKQNYAQLPEEEKEKDRVVARALLQAIKGQSEKPQLGEIGNTPVGKEKLEKYRDKAEVQISQHWANQLPADKKIAKRNAGSMAAGNRLSKNGTQARAEQGVAEQQLNELDFFAPVTTFIKMTNGSYIQADWRKSQGNAGLSDSASFVNFKPVNPNVARQLGLDSYQRNNSISNRRDGTIAFGGPIQGSGPLANRGYEVVDYNKPETMEELPPEIKSELIKWVQKQGVAEGYDPVESDYQQWEDILVKDGYRGDPSGAYALKLVVGHQLMLDPAEVASTIRNILTYVKQNRQVLGKAVSDRTTVKDAIIDIKNKFPQQYQAAQQPQGVAEGKRNLKCVCKTHGQDQCPVHAPMDEGWLKNTVAGVAIAGAALGAQARVTPDGQGGYTGGLKPAPAATQPAAGTAPARIDAPGSPSGFSKEYLQKAADPNRTGRYLISVEKAQQLLKQTQEGVAEGVRDLGYDAQSLIMKLRRDVEEKRLQPTPQAVLAAARELAGDMEFAPQLLVKQVLGQSVAEGNSGAKYKMVCKDCGDVFKKPTTNCKHDSHNSNGPNWIKKNKGIAEGGGTLGFRTWSGQVRLAHGNNVKFYNRKNDTINRVVAMKDLKLVGIFDRATDKGRVIDEDISRRGFLKTAGAAAVAGIGANSQAQPDQRQDLGNSFVTATATIDGITYKAIQDTISKSGYMLNQRSDGTPIVNRPGEFLVVRNGKIEARPSLAPNVMIALQKAGILSADDSQVQTQTPPAVTHSSHRGTNQPAVTHSSRGGTNQPAVTYSSSNRKPRNEDTTSRMKMDDYIKAADSLQSKLSNAIKLGDNELIQKLSKERDDLDARVKQHGLMPEASELNQLGKQPVGEANMQSLIVSYKNLIKRALGVAFGKKQNTSDPMAFQRMMRKVTAPLDSTQYSKLWQEYKNNPQYYISLPTMDEIENNKKIYFWSNSLAEFVMNKFPDASKEALLQAVEGLAQLAADEFKNKHRDLDEATQQKPRVRKYTKMRPDGSKAVRYEVLDHMGRRITGQGPEGFDDPKLAKDFYYKNYDRLASLDEIVDRSVSDTPAKPDMKKANGRYWCSEEKRWKDH